MHLTGRIERLERDLNTTQLQIVLLNTPSGFNNRTGLAEILGYECLVTSGGYAPVNLSAYTPGTAIDNQGQDRSEAPPYTAQFSEALAGAGYDHSHVALIKRDGMANKPVTLNVTTDAITCTAHGLEDGDRAVIRSTGALPGGAAISGAGYWVKAIDINTVELHSNAALTAKVNFTSSGSGQLYLQNCTGSLYEFLSNPGSINPGQTKSFQGIYWVR